MYLLINLSIIVPSHLFCFQVVHLIQDAVFLESKAFKRLCIEWQFPVLFSHLGQWWMCCFCNCSPQDILSQSLGHWTPWLAVFSCVTFLLFLVWKTWHSSDSMTWVLYIPSSQHERLDSPMIKSERPYTISAN